MMQDEYRYDTYCKIILLVTALTYMICTVIDFNTVAYIIIIIIILYYAQSSTQLITIKHSDEIKYCYTKIQ